MRRIVGDPFSSKLHVVRSQQDSRRRTRIERVLSRCWRRGLLAVGTVLGLLVVCAVGGALLAEMSLRPARRILPPDATSQAAAVASRSGAAVTSVPLVARDGAVLRAWNFAREGSARGTAILVHGVSDNRMSQLGLAALLLDHSYRVLAIDVRAHGSSGGPLASYGVLERSDLRGWTDWVRRQHPDECVFAIGASMGASIVLQTLPDEPFCAAIVEAPFASFRETVIFRLGGSLRVPTWLRWPLLAPIVECGLVYARLRHGLALTTADAVDAVARAHVPVLVVDDGADDNVPRGAAQRLAAANVNTVTVWTVPGARHTQGWAAAPREYPTRILAFLAAHQ
jgi:uncharacterized protein